MGRLPGSLCSTGALVAIALSTLPACTSMVPVADERPLATRTPDGRPTAAAFFRHPVLSHTAISPNGRNIAAIATQNGKQVLIVRPTRGGVIRPLAKLERSRRRSSWAIRTVGWPSDKHLLVSIEMPSGSAVGVNARQTRLLVVELLDGRSKYLGKNWRYQEYSQSQDNIISWLPDDPDHVLISLWMPGEPGAGARRVNIHNGALSVVTEPRAGSLDWYADHRDEVRAGYGEPDNSTDVFTLARVSPSDRFREIIRLNPYDEDGFSFAGFSEKPEWIFVYREGATGTHSVYHYDLAHQKLGGLVYSHPDVDVSGLRTSKLDGRLLAIDYVTDRPKTHFVDAWARRHQRVVDSALPRRINRFVSSDRSERLFIVESSSDKVPPHYYLYDAEKETVDSLYPAYPDLEGVQLRSMKPIRYRARDGLEIPGYLTRPAGYRKGPVPAIIYPHGGPWARDVWGWDPVVQFLASRGFAVLQPNFRGSDGYGREYLTRGYGAWGLAMQDDITDGARWLIDQGIADPERIGIYGASYGGFTALAALIDSPEIFRAGASFAGVTDIPMLLSDDKYYWSLIDDMERLVGDRWSDRATLKAISPARNADQIRSPVLIAHGTEDPRVHVSHARTMANALEKHDVEREILIYDGEVHGFLDERNRIDFYDRLARFFERHLAPRAGTGAAELEQSDPPSGAALTPPRPAPYPRSDASAP